MVPGAELVLTTVDRRDSGRAELVGATPAIGDVDVRLEGIDRAPQASHSIRDSLWYPCSGVGEIAALPAWQSRLR